MKSMRYTYGLPCALLLACLASLTQLVAQQPVVEPEKSSFMKFMEQDYLFGDWGGRRTWLKEHGADFEFLYFGAMPANLSGGMKDGVVYEGALMMLMDLYSDKLVGYQGGQLHVGSLLIHNGPEFSANYVGDLNKVSLLDFPDMFRLWELWYEQKFANNKFSLKFGQLAVDRDFIVSEYFNSLAGINYLNQTFFYPTLPFNVWDIQGFPVGYHALPSTPYGSPGARLRWDPVPEFYVQAAVYDGYPDKSRSGTRINLNSDEGALIYFEAGYRYNQQKEDAGLPGNYKVGGYYHTDDFYDYYSVFESAITGAAPFTRKGNYGGYFMGEQMLSREIGKEDPAQQGLVGFFRLAAAPSDRNLAVFEVDGGLTYKGLFPSRDWDAFSVGASYLKISQDIRDGQVFVNSFAPGTFVEADHETVFEASYRAQLTAWWTLQPDIQYVVHPGGSTALDNAVVFILQTTLRF